MKIEIKTNIVFRIDIQGDTHTFYDNIIEDAFDMDDINVEDKYYIEDVEVEYEDVSPQEAHEGALVGLFLVEIEFERGILPTPEIIAEIEAKLQKGIDREIAKGKRGAEKNEKAGNWYLLHKEHVDKLTKGDKGSIYPIGSDESHPELWKPMHWRWFLKDGGRFSE